MKRIDTRVIVGLALIAAGVLFLLQTFEIIPSDIPLIWVGAFGIGGLIFLYVAVVDRENWWALIPGCTLLGMSGAIALSAALPELGGNYAAAFFMGMIGLSFWLIYLVSRGAYWWAVIPGGAVCSVAAMIALEPFIGAGAAGVLLWGIAATFVLLYFLPTSEGRMTWALIPAGVLTLVGLLIAAAATAVLRYVWPAVLIVVGLYLLWLSSRRK